MKQAIGVFIDTLREIFDEAAYARFLVREGASSKVSCESYAEFLRERSEKQARRVRCC